MQTIWRRCLPPWGPALSEKDPDAGGIVENHYGPEFRVGEDCGEIPGG